MGRRLNQPRLIDVSAYQPHVDWQAVAASGVAGAFSKATEGATWKSPVYPTHISEARAAGLIVGAYHFFRTTSDPMVQARVFVEAATVAGPVDFCALDIEDQPHADPLGGASPAEFAEAVFECLTEIAKLIDNRPVAYVEPATWARLPVGQAQEIADLADLWIATYGPAPIVPHGWLDWTFWQYTDRESVPGAGMVDVSRYNGSLDELLAYAGAAP